MMGNSQVRTHFLQDHGRSNFAEITEICAVGTVPQVDSSARRSGQYFALARERCLSDVFL